MKRNLLKQMRAEWRANIWMAIEILLVSVVLFVLADKIYTAVATINEPLGFDSEHCYLLDVKEVSEAAPDFVEYPDRRAKTEDLITLINRLRERPEISAAALSINSYPYNFSNSNEQIDIDTFNMAESPLLRRTVEPEFFKVFRIEGANGETNEQLGEILERDRVIVSDNALYRRYGMKTLKPLFGSQMVLSGNDTLELHSSFKPMRYSDYSSGYGWNGGSMFTLLRPTQYTYANELSVRVLDNMDVDFAENLMKDADGALRVGNWYIASVQPFSYIKDNYNRNAKAEMRNTIVCALFLLLNIFLGILGTFWFRTQQRNKEIALRMVSGATRSDIFRRILGEGQILLLLVTPIAIVIDWLLTVNEFTSWYDGYFEPVHFCVSVLVAWALMALMIAIGVFFPARRAMSISPAAAMKSE